MAKQKVTRRLAAILAADMVGYSRLMEADERGTIARQKAHRKELIDPKIAEYNGRIVKTTGDGLLVEFASVVDATESAVAIQQAVTKREVDVPEERRIRYRVGINIGDIVIDGDDIYGDGVNVAARLEGLAEPGGICIPRKVFHEVRNKLDVGYEFLGEQRVKNIETPVPVYRIRLEPEAVGRVVGEKWLGRPRWRMRAILAAFLVAVAAGGGAWWWQFRAPTIEADKSRKSAMPLPDKPSIAVLPFDNLSQDKLKDYFTEGIADDIITDLSRISGLFVIARNSSFAYKGRQVSVRAIGRELGVKFLLKGSVRRAGDGVRINVQLIDAETGGHVWANRYEGPLKNVLNLQDKMAREVVSTLAVKMTSQEKDRLVALPTRNLEAYDFFVRAKQSSYIMEARNLSKSLSLFKRAIRLDPQFAEAHAGLARVAADLWRFQIDYILANPVARQRAYRHASRALELRPDLPGPHSILGMLQLTQREHDAAIASARKAVDLAPSSAEAHMDLALILAYSGATAEAVREAEIALRLDPKPRLGFLISSGHILFMDRQYERALTPLETARRAIRQSPDNLRHLVMVYAQLGRQADAEAATKEHLSRNPADSLAGVRQLYQYLRRKEDLDHRIDALRKAGFPEWPYGFTGRAEDRLEQSQITRLVFGRTWKGRFGTKEKFVQEFAKDGSFAIYTPLRLNTGSAKVKDNQLCLIGVFSGTDACGYIYRNPDGAAAKKNEYVYVPAHQLYYFSVVK